ncbi:MAG: GNAT family N-acetyltransferase [Ferruginibacter sp.]
MLIQNKEENNRGMFYVENDGEQLAEMDYSLSAGIMTIIHTEVDEKLKGKNVGLMLVNHAAEHARANHLKIIPICPFAKKVFDKRREEYKDVLY